MKSKRTALLVLAILLSGLCRARSIVVGKGMRLSDLGMALRECRNGDTLILLPGVYPVHGLHLRKSILLEGRGWPVLDAQYKGGILAVDVSHVSIRGLVLRNIPSNDLSDLAAISALGVGHLNISGNIIEHDFFGIYLANVDSSRVENNRLSSGYDSRHSGSGIHLWHCSQMLLKGNRISGQRDGIYFEFVSRSRILNNTSVGNLRYGLHFMFSDSDSYVNNVFQDNSAGVAVMYSHHILMESNRFEHQWGDASYGLLIKEITDSRILHNLFWKNTTGIYLEGANRMELKGNTWQDNGWAMNLMSDCLQDTIVRNNFIGNSFDIASEGDGARVRMDANYWSKYQGYDLNGDLVGDVPFHPVSLYARLIQEVPSAVLLMHSMLAELLDAMERALPSLTPKGIVDKHPSMKSYPDVATR